MHCVVSHSDEVIFDRFHMLSVVGGEEHFFQVLPDIIQQLHISIQNVDATLIAQKWDDVAMELHKLKGAAVMGFPKLMKTLQSLNQYIKTETSDLTKAQDVWLPVRAAIQEVLVLLESLQP